MSADTTARLSQEQIEDIRIAIDCAVSPEATENQRLHTVVDLEVRQIEALISAAERLSQVEETIRRCIQSTERHCFGHYVNGRAEDVTADNLADFVETVLARRDPNYYAQAIAKLEEIRNQLMVAAKDTKVFR